MGIFRDKGDDILKYPYSQIKETPLENYLETKAENVFFKNQHKFYNEVRDLWKSLYDLAEKLSYERRKKGEWVKRRKKRKK